MNRVRWRRDDEPTECAEQSGTTLPGGGRSCATGRSDSVPRRSMNSNQGPDLLAVCEIENRFVVDRFVERANATLPAPPELCRYSLLPDRPGRHPCRRAVPDVPALVELHSWVNEGASAAPKPTSARQPRVGNFTASARVSQDMRSAQRNLKPARSGLVDEPVETLKTSAISRRSASSRISSVSRCRSVLRTRPWPEHCRQLPGLILHGPGTDLDIDHHPPGDRVLVAQSAERPGLGVGLAPTAPGG
jgi:hypothetical protein